MPHPDLEAPAQLDDLLQGEHMLLWAFRASAFGAGGCSLVRKQFEETCGPMGLEALTALQVFVRELGLNGRRKVTLAAPGSYRITRDEQTVLALFAAAQAEDYVRMEAHLAWLLADQPRAPFPAAACLVAQSFQMNGYILRLPPMDAGPVAQAAPPVEDDGVVTPFRRRAS